MTARSQVALVALLAAVLYAIACFLPGEPRGAGRVTFVLDFAQPYRVPLAGTVEPLVKITADGQALSGPNYHFESLDPAVVRVDPTGRGLEGMARGSASVRVVYETATGAPDTTFTVRVVVSRVGVSRATLAFTRLADTSRLTATAYDEKDAAVPGVNFNWSTAEARVASVDTAGLVRALNEGTVAITAEADSVTGASTVSVTQVAAVMRMVPKVDTLRTVGRSARFLAVALDDTNGVIRTAKPHWSSSDERVARIDTTGLATATGAGTVKIIARVGAAADTAVMVVAQVVRFLAVTPSFDTLTAIADTVRHSAVAFDSLNFPIPKPSVAWATGDTGVAIVDATGLVRAAKNGVVLVTASSAGQAAFATVVVHQEVTAARISQDSVALVGAGDTVRLNAVGLDRNGYPVSGAAFSWRSGSQCVASVDAGLVTARGGGQTKVIATPVNAIRTDTAAISVTGVPSQGEIAYDDGTVGDVGLAVYDMPGKGIEVMCPGDDAPTLLIENGPWWGAWSYAYGPSWSPDGTRLAFTAKLDDSENAYGCVDIFTARADGSDRRRITNSADAGVSNTWVDFCLFMETGPVAWSPDGNQIAFAAETFQSYNGGNGYYCSEVLVANADGSKIRAKPAACGSYAWFASLSAPTPAWSPDGTKIAFNDFALGVASIYVMNADFTNAVQVTNGHNDYHPAWSPDGSEIAFSRDGHLWVMNAGGSGARDLNVPKSAVEHPVWSPDGARLVFQDWGGGTSLYVVNRDGTGLERVTSTRVALRPAWRRVLP